MRLSLAPRSMMSRIVPYEMNQPDTSGLDIRLDARSILAERPRSNSRLSSRLMAMFLSRRNKTPISDSSQDLSDEEEDSTVDQLEVSSSTNGKQSNSESKSSSENSKEQSTTNTSRQKNPNEKAITDNQKENGTKQAAEGEKKSINTGNLVSGSQKQSNNTASSVSESQKLSGNTGGLALESPKSSNSSASTGSKAPINSSDAGKSTSDGHTTGNNAVTEVQKNKDKATNQNQKSDGSKENSKDNTDNSKSAQGKTNTPAVDSKNGKDTSNKDVKNTAPSSAIPKNENLPPINSQESAASDKKSSDPAVVNTEKKTSPTSDELTKTPSISTSENKLATDIQKTDTSVSIKTDSLSKDLDLDATVLPDKDLPSGKTENASPNSLTPSAKAALDSEIPKITAKQTTNDNSHSDVVKWIVSVFGVLLFLTIVVYIVRLCLRHRRLGKAESPPPSPLINNMESMPREFSNNTMFDRNINNNPDSFYPFHEEERLRPVEMTRTYGRVI